MRLSDISIAGKLYGIVLTAMAGMLVITGIAQYQLGRIYRVASYASVNSVPSVLAMADAISAFQGIRIDLRDHITEPDPEKKAALDRAIQGKAATISQALTQYQQDLISNDEDRRLFVANRAQFRAYLASIAPVLDLSRQGRSAEAHEALDRALPIALRFDATLQRHMQFNKQLADAGAAEARSVRTFAGWFSLVAAILVLAVTSAVGWHIARHQLVRPIARIVDNLRRLSTGDLQVEMDGTERRDEVGDLARVARTLRAFYVGIDEERRLKEQFLALTQAVQATSTYEDFANSLAAQLAPAVGLIYAALYIVDEDRGQLRRVGGYGCDDAMHASSFAVGVGLIGQVARDQRPVSMMLTPEDHVGVSMGLGRVAVQAVHVAPIQDRGKTLAVLEVASLHAFDQKQMAFFDLLLPSLAERLQILAGTVATRELLEKTQARATAVDASAASQALTGSLS